MRLLNTQTGDLQEFVGNIPEYAILSHTWGDDEVSFQGLLRGDCQAKAGWIKITKCCEIAANDGWEWVWIDTCCIDKTSSAELSEAINSMFRWYEEAQVCYAYLCDVPSVSIQKSFWFGRGFTLQELLAPRYLLFIDQNWEEIGTRYSFSAEIEEATSITRDDLGHFRRCSIARKMSWASRRSTTRVEDMAYSLLGLFSINMPLLYGEGAAAFRRLQLEIMKSSDDESIFAWAVDDLGADPWPSFLASNPGAFFQANSVRPTQAQSSHEEYAVTKKGLLINVRLYTKTPYAKRFPMRKFGIKSQNESPVLADSGIIAQLNCCTEFHSMVGLWLGKHADGTYGRIKEGLCVVGSDQEFINNGWRLSHERILIRFSNNPVNKQIPANYKRSGDHINLKLDHCPHIRPKHFYRYDPRANSPILEVRAENFTHRRFAYTTWNIVLFDVNHELAGQPTQLILTTKNHRDTSIYVSLLSLQGDSQDILTTLPEVVKLVAFEQLDCTRLKLKSAIPSRAITAIALVKPAPTYQASPGHVRMTVSVRLLINELS